MIDIRQVRGIAERLLAGLEVAATNGDEKSQLFLEEQKGFLRKALDESATPERYKVAVVGSFKVGKSSFVNALCGQRVLTPVDANPETASITILQYAETPNAAAHMIRRDDWEEMKKTFEANPADARAARFKRIRELAGKEGGGLRLEELERDLISQEGVIQSFGCKDWDSKDKWKEFNTQIKRYVSRNDPLHYFVDHLVIQVPVPILKDGIDLIDTPGLDDTDRYRVLLTEEYVKDVDAILFLTRSGSSYSQSDKDFIVRQLRRKTIKHLRLVITKCDDTFSSAVDDAQARDDESPSFEGHLRREEVRVRAELKRTLDEMLAERDVDESGRVYFFEQLSGIHVDFISSKYHFNEHRHLSGIDKLRDDLNLMLQKSERLAKSRTCLIDSITRVSDRSSQVLKTRLGTVSNDFSAERVREQLSAIAAKVHGTLSGFKRKIKKEIDTLREENGKDEDFVDAKIEVILLRCDSTVDRYATGDIARHWRTRRCGNWGSLYQIQQQVADTIFPHVELLLQRQVKRFEDLVRRIQGHAGLLQRSFAKLEDETHLDVDLEPLALSESFRSAGESFVSQVALLVKEQRDSIVRHLDSFISEGVQEKIEVARSTVSNIYGRGTTYRQTYSVENFYADLKKSLHQSMAGHLRGQVGRFAQILLNQADSIYPSIKKEMSLLIDDRLDAIRSNLSELNEAQKAETLKALRQGVRCCEKAKKELQALDSLEVSVTGQNRQKEARLASLGEVILS